ncbi:hypothetical protein Cpap_1279 [Ruminiclostridium papyrosolvens DSM 2782]|uniref:Uncharacterized protein n=1 Tax=Ruminiclostridium papyrosolvens DSM 2782 TaxID=588581 RepID=F1TFK8_9FIRM|nr:hypothetical protein [Ruminiclostridium papyrosolvens]EGD46740.1 hypothetical protein Cpap_1279 [Ruminiclostridium papyrosolvens DSM 2782]WES34917.1 hypothetical protein P0092_02755 [Ruminiclostridium papyrosolvens DSM 2782]
MFDEKFIKEIKHILYLIFQYGIDRVRNADKLLKFYDIDLYNEFVEKVHTGFMIAQKDILLGLEKESIYKKKLKNRLSEANNSKNKDLSKELRKKISETEDKEFIYRKLADSIAWQLVQLDGTSIRRLYRNVNQIDIKSANITHDIKTVDEIFDANKLHFPLISDITSFMQVGDLLICDREKNRIGIIELKEGLVNQKIEKIIDDFSKTQCEYMLYLATKDENEKFHKQFDRYIKQQRIIYETINTINTGKGVDNATGMNISIPNDVFEVESFDQEINKMLMETNKKNYSIRVIDDCLLVGVYNNIRLLGMVKAFIEWVRGLKIEFPIINFANSLRVPAVFPIFLHPFSLEDKIKIVNSEKTILMCLDIEKWLKQMSEYGITHKILSKKETAHINSNSDIKAFEYKGQAIEITYEGTSGLLYDSIFSRMFYELTKPKSLIKFLIHMRKEHQQLVSELTVNNEYSSNDKNL